MTHHLSIIRTYLQFVRQMYYILQSSEKWLCVFVIEKIILLVAAIAKVIFSIGKEKMGRGGEMSKTSKAK